MKLSELFEMAKAREFSSGFMKDKKATKLANEFKRGKGTFELSDGRVFKGSGVIAPTQLKKGHIVLASYNEYNQGAQLYQILGVTKGDGSTTDFDSVEEMLATYDAETLKDVEVKTQAHPRLIVKDLEDGDTGPWFYIHNGEWSLGSGAEKLTFTRAVEVDKSAK